MLSAPYCDRSTTPPTCSKFGSTEYSTWPRSGAFPAWRALNILAYVPASPEVVSSRLTWMSGWLLFQRPTDCEMPGTQDQNVSVTFPPAGPAALVDEPPLLHAASASAAAAVVSASSCLPRWRDRLLELRSEDDMRCYLLILPAARPAFATDGRTYLGLGALPN
jgi:hypothetical protein